MSNISRNCWTFSKVATLSYNQPAIYGSSNVAISLPKCVTIDVFDYNHLSVLSSGISLQLHLIISQMNNDVKYLFLCVLALSLSVRDIFCIFREISTQILCPFINWIIFFLILRILIQGISEICFANVFPQSMSCFFYLVDGCHLRYTSVYIFCKD